MQFLELSKIKKKEKNKILSKIGKRKKKKLNYNSTENIHSPHILY